MSRLHKTKTLLGFFIWVSFIYVCFMLLPIHNPAGAWVMNTTSAQVTPVRTLENVSAFQEVLVQYRPEATFSDIVNTYRTMGLNETAYSPYSGFRKVRVPANASVYSVAATLTQNPLVVYAEPNYVRMVHFVPNDPLYVYQWHLCNSLMERAWDISTGSNVIVAVLDTGIAYRTGDGFVQAPDLAHTAFTPGYDFINDDDYPDDDNRHGTHIAGTIAQNTHNLFGGAGVASGCTIMPVKVLDEDGFGDVASIVEGIYYAANNGAQVINMSLGGTLTKKGKKSKSSAEETAINYAVSQGVTVICSAGNESTSLPSYPAAYDATIGVSATKIDQSFASVYSNYGTYVDVCAPGGDLNEDLNEDGYPDGIYQQTHDGEDYTQFDFYFAEGTSSAAAFVSGVAALIVAAANRPLTPAEVRDFLQGTAIDLGDQGWDQYYGWGLVNPLAAVQAALPASIEGAFLTPWNKRILRYPILFPASALPAQSNALNGVSQANARFAPSVVNVTNLNRSLSTAYQVQNTFSLIPSFPSLNLLPSHLFSLFQAPSTMPSGPYQSESDGYRVAAQAFYYEPILRNYPFSAAGNPWTYIPLPLPLFF